MVIAVVETRDWRLEIEDWRSGEFVLDEPSALRPKLRGDSVEWSLVRPLELTVEDSSGELLCKC